MTREESIAKGWKYEDVASPYYKEVAYRETAIGVEVYTGDKVHYTEHEIAILKGDSVPPALHVVKKLFNGTIVPNKE